MPTPTIDCNCPACIVGSPSQFLLTIQDVTISDCDEGCLAFNDTFTLTYSDGCTWESDVLSNTCPGGRFSLHILGDDVNCKLRMVVQFTSTGVGMKPGEWEDPDIGDCLKPIHTLTTVAED